MKNIIVTLLSLAVALGATAGSFIVTPDHARAQYQPYPDTVVAALTPPPAGYEPFHIEHYGRHGSRWLIDPKNYSVPVEELSKAERAGVLTPLGADILAELRAFQEASRGRLGELTPLGADQHRRIARRMAANFPEVITDSTVIDARSTVVIRCILSMLNAVGELRKAVPGATVRTDASERDMWYMNHHDPEKNAITDSARTRYYEPFANRHLPSGEFLGRLISDKRFAADSINLPALADNLMEVALNVGSTPEFEPMLTRIFSAAEINEAWLRANASWFLNGGNSALNNGRGAMVQRHLLRNMIESADTAFASLRPSANLRFGHETMVMSLAVLLNLGDYGAEHNDFDTLASQWRAYEIFPMACNLQMIFYRRPGSTDPGDILVKFLLNEREMPVSGYGPGPYYRWAPMRDALLRRANSIP